MKTISLCVCMLQKQIEALKDLCLKAGIKDADIAACAPHCTSRCISLLIITTILLVQRISILKKESSSSETGKSQRLAIATKMHRKNHSCSSSSSKILGLTSSFAEVMTRSVICQAARSKYEAQSSERREGDTQWLTRMGWLSARLQS
jgi:hypothetical protein